jgi:energy-converting hydrogenase Eha subunit A
VRAVISFVLAFVLTFAFVGIILVGLVWGTAANKEYLQRQMIVSNYVATIEDEITATFESYAASSGIEAGYFTSNFNSPQLTDYIQNEAAKIYGPAPTGFNQDDYKEQLVKQLKTYAQVREIEVTPEVEEALNYLADLCAQEYAAKVGLPMVGMLNSAMSSLTKVLVPALIFCIVVAVLAIALIFKVRPKKRRFKAFRYICSAVIAAGMTSLIGGFLAQNSGVIERVAISSKALYELVVSYCYGIFEMMMAIGAVIVLAGFLAAFIFYVARRMLNSPTSR